MADETEIPKRADLLVAWDWKNGARCYDKALAVVERLHKELARQKRPCKKHDFQPTMCAMCFTDYRTRAEVAEAKQAQLREAGNLVYSAAYVGPVTEQWLAATTAWRKALTTDPPPILAELEALREIKEIGLKHYRSNGLQFRSELWVALGQLDKAAVERVRKDAP